MPDTSLASTKRPPPSSVGKRDQPSVADPPTEGKARPKRSRRRRGNNRKRKKTVVDAEGWNHPARTAAPQAREAGQPMKVTNRYQPLEQLPVEESVAEEPRTSPSVQRTVPQVPRRLPTPPRPSPRRKNQEDRQALASPVTPQGPSQSSKEPLARGVKHG